MESKTIKYAYLMVSALVLGLTILGLVGHFQKPNLRTTEINRNFLQAEDDNEDQPIRPQQFQFDSHKDFSVLAGQTVHLTYEKGRQIDQLVSQGQVQILNAKREVVFTYDLLGPAFGQDLTLAAGDYQLVERIDLKDISLVKDEGGIWEIESDRYVFAVHVF